MVTSKQFTEEVSLLVRTFVNTSLAPRNSQHNIRLNAAFSIAVLSTERHDVECRGAIYSNKVMF